MRIETTERRRQPRTTLSQVILIRPLDSRLPPDSCTTFNVSQDGLYLATSAGHYAPGMNVYVTSDFRPDSQTNYAMAGVVVRVEKLEENKWGVAIHIFSPSSSTVQ
jgi:hypothetical protein